MIRLHKNKTKPLSLETNKQYDGEDVKALLLLDHDSKCYLCERSLVTDFEIEHFQSATKNENLRFAWENLFLACGYCNKKKSDKFDDILNPLKIDVENVIEQRLDYSCKKAVFKTSMEGQECARTIELLNLIFNGKSHVRNLKEEKFFHYIMSVITHFLKIVDDYLNDPQEEKKDLLRSELSKGSELLGFKYWIVKDHSKLFEDFKDDIVWNKQDK